MSQSKVELNAIKLKMMEDYHQTLLDLRKRCFDEAKHAEMNSEPQSTMIDTLFVLDFMLASNQRFLDYLNHLKAHQNPLSTNVLGEILNALTIKDGQGIHTTIEQFSTTIVEKAPHLSHQLKLNYDRKGTIYGYLSIGLGISALIFTMLPNIIPIGFCLSFILVCLVMALVFKNQMNVYAQPGNVFYQTDDDHKSYLHRTEQCLKVLDAPNHYEDSFKFKKSYARDIVQHSEFWSDATFRTETTILRKPSREMNVSHLHEKINREVASKVDNEYIALTAKSSLC